MGGCSLTLTVICRWTSVPTAIRAPLWLALWGQWRHAIHISLLFCRWFSVQYVCHEFSQIQKYCPDIKEKGLSGLPRLILFHICRGKKIFLIWDTNFLKLDMSWKRACLFRGSQGAFCQCVNHVPMCSVYLIQRKFWCIWYCKPWPPSFVYHLSFKVYNAVTLLEQREHLISKRHLFLWISALSVLFIRLYVIAADLRSVFLSIPQAYETDSLSG